MWNFLDSIEFGNWIPLIRTVAIALILFIIFRVAVSFAKKSLIARAKTRKQISNITIFSRIITYVFLILIVIAAGSAYTASWAGFGIGVGLFSAALGWALQRPITGIAAWIMLIVKRPFNIGDRIIIGDVRGDVVDISLTHISIGEIGGIIGGEERSGRVVLVPNSTLFEKNIINYTSSKRSETILDQVSFIVTLESDIEKAEKIALDTAKEAIKKVGIKEEPYTRIYFHHSGINVTVRYFAPATRLQEFSSKISKSIFYALREFEDIELAYPHQEVILKNRS